jgi:hypothetical protein
LLFGISDYYQTLVDSMPKVDNEIPAWLMCEDILNKIKTELITQAMDKLQEAIDSKAIEVNGSLVTVPDKPSDTEMKMFIINKLIEEHPKIMEKYKGHLSEDAEEKDPTKVQQRERLKKFLLTVEQISNLMQYSHVFDPWMHDVAIQVLLKDPAEVIRKTINDDESRIDVLKYVLNNKKMEKEEILTKKEYKILKKGSSS